MIKICIFRVDYSLLDHLSIFKYSLLSVYGLINCGANCTEAKCFIRLV